MKISEIITDKYKLCIPPTTYYELLADVIEVEEEQKTLLDKIRTEIKLKIVKRPGLDFKKRERDRNDAFLEVLDIIDKYKTESEG